MLDLQEIEAIKQLKYRYFRFLDCKRWDELADCFAEDAVCSYDGGRYSAKGRVAVMEFLRGALGHPRIISLHQAHHPEIDITGPSTATGIWYLEDYVINLWEESPQMAPNSSLRGAGFYEDEYIKLEGVWKFQSTGYERTFEERQDRGENPSLQVRSRFDEA